ncbi:MAG: A/G-specific adenine glycosylase [Pseudomonadota bacterium]
MSLPTDARTRGRPEVDEKRLEPSTNPTRRRGAAKATRRGNAGRLPPIAELLLSWYAGERRDLPWRAAPGELADPYRVWLSEIMLQQTTVKAVVPYFEKFCRLWPTVEALAAADREDVLTAWAGLGYYSRANNLHACAQIVAAEHGGQFPPDELDLRKLPGVGPYTAAAISAIAFARKATPVDGNIERVMARVFACEEPLPKAKPLLKAHAESVTPAMFAGDFAQAQMDLGATICTPRKPSCMMCPLKDHCRARALGIEAQLPRKLAKAAKPERSTLAFVAVREDGYVLLRKREATGLLANMIEVPSTPWDETPVSRKAALKSAPVKAAWWDVPGSVTHTFTHFRLTVEVVRAVVPTSASLTLWAEQDRCRWVHRDALDAQALPSVMKKILARGLDGLT